MIKPTRKKRKRREQRREERRPRQTEFIDQNGVKWRLSINGLVMKRLKQECGFNVCSIIDEKSTESLVSLMTDIERFVDALWICAEENAVDLGKDEIEFARGLFGDAIDDAAKAFTTAIVNFFPNRSQRESLQNLMNSLWMAGDAMLKQRKIATEEIERSVKQAIAGIANTGN